MNQAGPGRLGKTKAVRYVELCYFTMRGCVEFPNRSISQNIFGFIQIDDTFATRPLPRQRR